jgi:type VI secretion system secreted protein VgrG
MAWTQANRPYRLKTPLGDDTLLLVTWEGEEHVSAFFRYTVTAISTRGDISAKDLLLKKVSLQLRLSDGSDRTIHGVVSRLARGGTAPMGYVAYQIEIMPPHWVLSLDEGFDIFQNKSAREVADELLQGTPHEWKLTGTLAPRPYCFRYRESRWNCIARLMEQEGVFFRYDHKGGEAKLVLGDSVASAQPAWGVATMKFNEVIDVEERLTSLRMESQPFVSETRVRSASEFLFTKNVGDMTSSNGAFSPPSDVKSYRFEQQITGHRTGIAHGGGDTQSDAAKLTEDAKRYSRIRQEMAEALSEVYIGESRYCGLESGAKTTVAEHPNASMNVSLFVLSVQHEGSNGSYESSDDSESSYQNKFKAIPSATPFRPARTTPWPHVGGSHVGVVVGPPGEEIYPDKHGRVQVVFKWDRDDNKTLDYSCWIRVAQSFAGQRYGSVFLPRIGHEVLVEFLDGNPDNPVVVGSLYNGTNMPPWELPAHKTQSGVRTKSTLKGGAENYNELRFEDLKDSEQIYVQAEKDLDTLVKNNETRQVLNDRSTEITRHDTKEVKKGNDTTTVLKGEQFITITENNRTLDVGKNHTITVSNDESTTIGNNRTVSVGADQSVTIGAKHTVDVGDSQTRTIEKDDKTEVKKGDSALAVKMGNIDVVADMGDITINAKLGAITLQAMKKIELKVGGSSIVVDMSGVKITGPMVTVEGKAMAEVKAPMVQVSGQAMVMIKGGITMIN